MQVEYTLKDRNGNYQTKERTFSNERHFQNFVKLAESQGKKLIGSTTKK